MYQALRTLTTFSRSGDRKLALAVALGKGGLNDLQVDFSLYQTGTGLRPELLSMPLRLVSAMTNKLMPPAGRFPKEMRGQNRTVYLLKNRSTLFVDNRQFSRLDVKKGAFPSRNTLSLTKKINGDKQEMLLPRPSAIPGLIHKHL